MSWFGKSKEQKEAEEKALREQQEAQQRKEAQEKLYSFKPKYAESARTVAILHRQFSQIVSGDSAPEDKVFPRIQVRVLEKMEGFSDPVKSFRVVDYTVDSFEGRQTVNVAVLNQIDPETGKHKPVSYYEAMMQLSSLQKMAEDDGAAFSVVSEEDFNSDIFPALKKEVFEKPLFENVAYAEGLRYDLAGKLIPTDQGKLIHDGSYPVAELAQAASVVERKALALETLEEGVLSELFSQTAAKPVKTEDQLNQFKILAGMKKAVDHISIFYMALSFYAENAEEKAAEVAWLSKYNVYANDGVARVMKNPLAEARRALDYAESAVDSLEENGAFVKPFQKFIAECRVAMNLIHAQKLMNEHGASRASEINEALSEAIDAFKALGAGQYQIDMLKSTVLRGNSLSVPAKIGKFVSKFNSKYEELMKLAQIKPSEVHAEVLGANLTDGEIAYIKEGNRLIRKFR
jgi:hypothetical protein